MSCNVRREKPLAIDPVCKMEVDENRSRYGSRYNGKSYHFCSASCKKKFDEDPEKYAKMVQQTTDEKCCE
jgi:YHS domain-containing protein